MYCVCTYTLVYVCVLHMWRLKADMQYLSWLLSTLSFYLELSDWARLVEQKATEIHPSLPCWSGIPDMHHHAQLSFF